MLRTLTWILLIITAIASCKPRQDMSMLQSESQRSYDVNKRTNVVQELFKGLRYAGNVQIALSPDGKVLATAGAVLNADNAYNSDNDIRRHEFEYNYENQNQRQGVVIYLWDAYSLSPLGDQNTVKRIRRDDLTGVQKIAFTTDGRGLAVCAENGLAFWPNIQNQEEVIFWNSQELPGKCQTIAFGRVEERNVDGNSIMAFDALAIGTSTGLSRYLHTREKPSLEQVCNFARPVRALAFLDERSTLDGSSITFANRLLVTVGSGTAQAHSQLQNSNAQNALYGIMPFMQIPAIGRLSSDKGLQLGNFFSSKKPAAQQPLTCERFVTHPLSANLKNPGNIATHRGEIILAPSDNRYIEIFTTHANPGDQLQYIPSAKREHVVSAERNNGVSAVAMGGPYSAKSGKFYMTGQGDRTLRLWQYNIDGNRTLDTISQINLGFNNIATDAVFLKHRPAAIFSDRGGVYVWEFLRSLQPSPIHTQPRSAQYSAIAMNDRTDHVYLGTNQGEFFVDSYATGAGVSAPGRLFKGAVTHIQVSHDLRRAIIAAGSEARLMPDTSNPSQIEALSIWNDQPDARIAGYGFATDNSTIFSVSQNGEIRSISLSQENISGYRTELGQNEQVVSFSIYPMEISYERLSEIKEGQNVEMRSLEIHPVIAPIVNSHSSGMSGIYPPELFQIFGENKRAKIDAITKTPHQLSAPQLSSENPDIVAGSGQTPTQRSDQKNSDKEKCSNNQCFDIDLQIQEAQRAAPKFQIKREKTTARHLKVALLLNTGRIIMVDLQGQKQWNLEYRTSPVLPFSGYFQKVFSPIQRSFSYHRAYLTNNTPQQDGYLAKEIHFDDDGGCLMILIRSGEHLRCLPILQSSGTNAPAITSLSSKPAKSYLDPWIVYNTYDRKLMDFSFAQHYTAAIAADSSGGITSFDLNYFRMFPYSLRMHRLSFIQEATRGAAARLVATTSTSNFAVAIHADNIVRLHWIDRAFELPLLDIRDEELDALRSFAQ